MITAVSTAKKLDWSGWVTGIFGSIISGGAGAVGAAFGTILVDPKDFNVMGGGLHKLLISMGITFMFSAIISLAKWLQTHPVPDAVTIQSEGQVTVNVNPPKAPGNAL